MAADVLALQRRLRITFRNPDLLAQAFVHRSYLNEAAEQGALSNERLEFLGDAVLGLVVARWLYLNFPHLPEGRMTEMRAHLVRWEALAGVAVRLQLGQYLRMGRGEEATGGRERPLTLARTFEAVVGAVYLDRGETGFRATERWILKIMAPELAGLERGPVPEDAKSRLQHLAQVIYSSTPRYRIVSAEGPDHDKHFTVEVTLDGQVFAAGTGRSKRAAEKEAAHAAVIAIETQHPKQATLVE